MYQEHPVVAEGPEDADSRVDMWSALIVLVALAVSFLLFAGGFDGAL